MILVLALQLLQLFVLVKSAESRQLVNRFKSLSKATELRKYDKLSALANLEIAGPLLGPLLTPRVSGTQGNLDVQQHIINHFTQLGWHIEQDRFNQSTPFGQVSFNNIIVTKDIKAQRRLTLAAHFDSKHFDDFEFIGATDSAVPCAILMHIGSTLNDLLEKKMAGLDRFTTLQLIFFDGEEAMIEWTDDDSIYGAKHLAETWSSTMYTLINDDQSTSQVTQISQMDALVLLDLLGTRDATVPNSQPSTQWIWDRLSRIHEKLAALKLLSPYMQDRVKRGDYMFPPGRPTLQFNAVQARRPTLTV
ncbi:hypothetical protein HDU91_004173 [Kappamyces sp. JEL0680]|nr:hypothetical protein HDU91_004173 [Kappamyces sp. JEL0680]